MADPGGVKWLTMTFVRPAGLPGIHYSAEVSDALTLEGWAAASTPTFAITPIVGTPNEQVTVRALLPVGSSPQQFMRLRVTEP